jgi:Virulence factor membrane-bound polymerase, C-terminal
VTLRSAWVMLLLIALHSLLEYPLWYAYFLLPAAWLCGYGLGTPAAQPDAAAVRPPQRPEGTNGLFVGGLLLVIGSALSVLDYVRVAQVFMPAQGGAPLSERIAAGRRSWLFAHHADYAAVTTDESLSAPAEAFGQAPHFLMDTRLMMAWAHALAQAGEGDKARHLAQRLREFRNPAADEFFEACDEPRGDAPAPFQCEAPARVPGWREYLR